MITQDKGQLAYLLQMRRLNASQVTVVNEVAYWYDHEEVNVAIQRVTVRIVSGADLAQAWLQAVSRIRSLFPGLRNSVLRATGSN